MKKINTRTQVKLLTAYRAKHMSMAAAFKRLGNFKTKHNLY
jgi:hypothetical protein